MAVSAPGSVPRARPHRHNSIRQPVGGTIEGAGDVAAVVVDPRPERGADAADPLAGRHRGVDPPALRRDRRPLHGQVVDDGRRLQLADGDRDQPGAIDQVDAVAVGFQRRLEAAGRLAEEFERVAVRLDQDRRAPRAGGGRLAIPIRPATSEPSTSIFMKSTRSHPQLVEQVVARDGRHIQSARGIRPAHDMAEWAGWDEADLARVVGDRRP